MNTPSKGAAPAPTIDLLNEPDPKGPREYPGPQAVNTEQGPPRLVIHHVAGKLRPEVEALGIDMKAKFIDVGQSDTAYFESFEKLWAAGRGFINVEQDVVPTPALLTELWRCPEELCAGWYWRYSGAIADGESRPRRPIRHRVTGTLACVKFSRGLLARLPDAMAGAVRRTNNVRRWSQLDLALNGVLEQYHAVRHLHGPLTHLHDTTPSWASQIADDEWVDG